MRPHHLPGWVALVGVILLALLVASPAEAREPPTRVSVLTMGPGDHPFTRFGHNAILLEWPDGVNAVYNFGTFEFDGVQGAEDFMAGKFRYWLSVGSLEGTQRAYRTERRSLAAQELSLTAEERARLADALADNALPEHRYYDYDYYRDNCSTRVRDALNRLLHGELHRGVTGTGRLTFRQHTLRLVGDTSWLYFGLDVALGAPTDRPTTRWEELFLPKELHDELSHATRTLGDERVPLVRAERQLLPEIAPRFSASRQLEARCSPPAVLASDCCSGPPAGERGGAACCASCSAQQPRCSAQLSACSAQRSPFSQAPSTGRRIKTESLLACPPWALALAVLGVAFALGRPWSARLLRFALGASLIASTLLLLLSLPSVGRESLRMAALFLPLWAGWFAGARLATRQPT